MSARLLARESRAGGVVSAVGTIGLATLASRVLGYVRDMVVAQAFGRRARHRRVLRGASASPTCCAGSSPRGAVHRGDPGLHAVPAPPRDARGLRAPWPARWHGRGAS